MILKILALIAALKSGDYIGAITILLEIIKALANGTMTAAECDVCHAALTAAYAAKKP